MKIMSRILPLIIVSLIFIDCGGKEAEADTSQTWERQAVPVKTQQAEAQTFLNELQYNGSLQAIQTARIIPEIPAKIARLFAQIGDFVNEGDTLAQMDISTLQLQYKQAEAGLSVAFANLQDARKNWERVQTLRSESAVSQQQFEKTKLGLEAAEAQLDQARAGLDLLRMQLDKSTLTAPFKGVVTQKGFEEGDLFSPAAMMPLYTVQDVSRIKVELQVTSREIQRMRKWQDAYLQVEYLPERILGEVTLVSVAADPMSKTFFVECQFDNSNGALLAGTFGQVDVVVDKVENVIVIPRPAVINDDHVFVVNDRHAYRRSVEIMEESLDEVVIGSGLTAGERYVIEGAYILSDSSLVTIQDEG